MCGHLGQRTLQPLKTVSEVKDTCPWGPVTIKAIDSTTIPTRQIGLGDLPTGAEHPGRSYVVVYAR